MELRYIRELTAKTYKFRLEAAPIGGFGMDGRKVGISDATV